jgi:hypothetical protein
MSLLLRMEAYAKYTASISGSLSWNMQRDIQMTTKTLSSGIRIDDNRSINCGVSISNQNNPMYYLWYNSAKNEFAFTQKENGEVFYMEDVSEYLNALADIIQAMAEANEFVTETK